MNSQLLSRQALVLLDTANLRVPSHAIHRWLQAEMGWAVALYGDDESCVGLILAVEENGDTVCTTLAICVSESDDTLTYRLVSALCDQVDELRVERLHARLPQANKGVIEALKVMGVNVMPIRSSPVTDGPAGHFAA